MQVSLGPLYFETRRADPSPFKTADGHDPHKELLHENPLSAQGLEVLHVGNDILLDYAHRGPLSSVGGVAAGVVAVGALGWGLARLKSDALPDKIDGVGLLALSAASTLEAVAGGPHAPTGLLAPLGAVHGLAAVGVGISELLRAPKEGPAERYAVGAFGIAMGAAITASALLPGMAPALHIAAGVALAGKEAAINWSLFRR
ncbi:MAG: hypothetical protein AB1758_06105 [Candidatus Eremiobacterota bacterium]